MSSAAQIAANQVNAQSSSGPRTSEGKTASSLNALKHGLTAATILIPGEDPVVYQCFTDGMLDSLNPLDTAEAALVLEIVDLQWRLRRGSRFEAQILSVEPLDSKALNNISLHTSRITRQYCALSKDFRQMHRANLLRRQQEIEAAKQVHIADALLKRPSTLAQHGFVFTPQEVAIVIRREEEFKKAQDIVRNFKNQCQKGSAQAKMDDLGFAA